MLNRTQLLARIRELDDQIDDCAIRSGAGYEARRAALLQRLEWYLKQLGADPSDPDRPQQPGPWPAHAARFRTG